MFEDLYEACGIAKEPLKLPSVVTVLDYVKPSSICEDFTCTCDPSVEKCCEM